MIHMLKSVIFVKVVQNRHIPDDYILMSLDVKSLFTNIPKELVIKNVKLEWKNIRQHTKIPVDEFLDILEFCLDNSHCSFQNNDYKQIFGTPMGPALLGVIADLIIKKLETDIFKKIKFTIYFL